MEVIVLDQKFNGLAVLDTFESFIWTERYRGFGDFEIYIPAEASAISILKPDNYITIRNTNCIMIIEGIQINTDIENGNYLTFTGRSLESILDRRIVWGQTILTGNFQEAVQKLLNENVISPSNPSRKISNFIFQTSTDKYISSLTIDSQFYGDNLYDVILALCEEKEIGFRVLPTINNGFIFELYRGTDRSYAQNENQWVVFSPSFENLFSSDYVESSKILKTATLVAGEGEGSERKTVEVSSDNSGLLRREIFTDASSISSKTDDGTLSEMAYLQQLEAKGREALAETSTTKFFDGEIDATRQFVYNRDFYIGDIVQVTNEYGMEASFRISEVIYSNDVNGEKITPTFTVI